jgi:sugar lactone lactonase YvrE
MNLLEHFAKLSPGNLITIAGAGYRDGIPAKEADAGWPFGIVRLPQSHPHAGDMVVADYQAQRIWRIDGEGILHTLAGDGIPGWTGDGGPATEARLQHPHDLCLDHDGNLYVNDQDCMVFRRIDAQTGLITLVAGSGKFGRGGDGGPAIDAETDTTCGIAVARNGDIYIASEWSNNVRRIDAKTGIIERFAGQDGRYYPAESGNSRPYGGQWCSFEGYHGDGGPAIDAAFRHPEHLAFDSKGDLYVCDNSNDRIRKIDMHSGIITTVLGNGQRASNGDGGPAIEASTLMPDAICFDVHDNMYVGEKYGFRVRRVDAVTGIVTTLVGTGEPGFGAEGLPGSQTRVGSVEGGVWADPDGTVFYCDCSGRARRYDGATGIVTTILGGTSVHDGEVATDAFLNGVEGMDIGPDGHIYLADRWNQRIRAIDPVSGMIRGIAGNGARAYGGDGGPANDAYLGNPSHVAVDSQGRVTISDNRHSHVRRIDEDGIITTIAGTGQQWDKGDGGPAISACFDHTEALVYADNDDLFISDVGVGRIRKVEAATGVITTVAGTGLPGYTGDGGPATEARIGSPSELALSRDDFLYFSDRTHHVIRRIELGSGVITTVVGNGQAGYSPDGMPAQQAQIDSPCSIALAPGSDELYFSDTGNNRVRRVDGAGRVETVVGNGEHGSAADDTPATTAPLNKPHGLCFFDSHILLISDFYNNQVKAVKIRPTPVGGG